MPWVAAAIVGGAVIGGVASDRASSKASKATRRATAAQERSGQAALLAQEEGAERAQQFFDPFAGVAERGVAESSFLANPQAQFDFLQNNPLFQGALEGRDRSTAAAAASLGRLGAGDTGLEFAGNFLQAATPLIDRQRADIGNLLNLGTGIAGSQANIATGLAAGTSGLLTDIGNVQAAGIAGQGRIGAERDIAIGQNLQNALLTGAAIFGQRPPSGV